MTRIGEDIRMVLDRDPAAKSWLEVVLCYPGLHAIWGHRITNWFWKKGFRFPARFLSQIIRLLTGIEIHPAATIGRRLFIDHGMGVVIGETAILGNDITLYQGVTLGGTGKERGKRHPTLRSGVFVGNNANILGNITVGENSRVGAGSVVLRDVPPDSTVVGVPAHVIYREGKRVLITDPREVKDPLSDSMVALAKRVEELESCLMKLHGELHGFQGQAAIHNLDAEEEESAEYRRIQQELAEYVDMGEGI